MKHTKKLFGLLLAVVMVFAMSVSVFADATTYTITINNAQTGHTYEAYQIFKGTLTETTDAQGIKTTKLTDIVWGTGVTTGGQNALGTAEAKAKTLTDEDAAAAFAKEVASYLQNAKTSIENSGAYTIADLEPGYYLVKDKDNTLTDQDDCYTAYIMKVVGNVMANPKSDKPTLDKQIKHNEKDTWGVVGDNQIGDTVEFRTITTVPSGLKNYSTYNYEINDTMSTGLTSNVKTVDDITVKVKDATVLDKQYYTVTVDNANANQFKVKIDILKAIEDGVMHERDELYTYYTGVLNENAKVYDEGKQDNTAYLVYSNNPNDTKDNGKTPEKKVYDWTFKMGIDKVDGAGNALTGAVFVLSKDENLTITADENGVPTSNTDKLIAVTANPDGTYTVDQAGTAYVISAGSTTIKGLDDETDYYLYETKAPTGYNKLTAPVKFKIHADTASYGTDGATEPTVTVDVADKTGATEIAAKIVNQEGSSLPSTGGIGTTVFYVVGGILMAGAAILLITKKKMSNK